MARQFAIGPYRFDLLFEDRHRGKLIVEIQKGTLDRGHTYKILDYYHQYRESNKAEFIDVMVVANQITAERKNRLHDLGVEYREIHESRFSHAADESPVIPGRHVMDEQQAVVSVSPSPLQGERTALGRGRREKKGSSAFAIAVRTAIAQTPAAGRWSAGSGDGSLAATFLPAKQLVDHREGGAGFKPQLWMERPRRGKATCKFEVAGRIRSLSELENIARREKIANSMRTIARKLGFPDGVEASSGSTVANCQVSVAAIKTEVDDTPDTVAQYGEVARIVDFYVFMDAALSAWVTA